MEQNNCLFCEVFSEKKRVVFDSEYFFVILDNFPVSKGHALVIPKRHQADIFSVTGGEWGDLSQMLQRTKTYLDNEYKPDGYNIGINCGEAAGQTIFHLHIHIIPRYKGDVEKPRGGIRNFKKPLAEY
jgi:diadenosine tetraphosphate (Ap4A) HIT family hydrolase